MTKELEARRVKTRIEATVARFTQEDARVTLGLILEVIYGILYQVGN